MNRAYPPQQFADKGPSASLDRTVVTTFVATLRQRLPLLGVGLLYLLALLIIPVMTPVAIGDDWVYARSVEILIHEGRVRILDLSVVTLVWQVLWGGLFSAILGPTFGAMRLSTVVLSGLAGLACYGCCRQVGAEPGRAALGAALYLFNPLLFSISYSFMSDAHFVGLLTISTYYYLRGLRPDRPNATFTVIGSLVAGLAFLERQQGALIPLAVITYLLLSGRWRPNRAGIKLFVLVVALPAAMTVTYYLWFRFVQGIPKAQGDFLQKVKDTGIGGAFLLAGRLAVIEAIYAGAFLLPLVLATLFVLPRLLRAMRPLGWLVFSLWTVFIAGSGIVFWQSGRRMPYIPHYVAPYGLGSYDLRGGRPWLIDQRGMDIITIICTLAALLVGLLICVGLSTTWGRRPTLHTTAESVATMNEAAACRAGAGLTIALAFWQLLGVLPQSFTFQHWTFRGYNAPSLDRYLLPLLPLTLILVFWAIREVRAAIPVAWMLTLSMAIFSIIGTRDFLVFHAAVWGLANQLTAEGVKARQIDAGAGWDGYHLYDYSVAHGITTSVAAPWWIGLFAPADTADYIVAGAPRDDFSEKYAPIRQVEYSSWLNPEPTYLYILRRFDVPGPP